MPRRCVQLLDRLAALGFTDQDFRLLHHFAETETIHGFRTYCYKTESFRPLSNNEHVKERLEHVPAAFIGGGYKAPAQPGVFHQLCQGALREIPK